MDAEPGRYALVSQDTGEIQNVIVWNGDLEVFTPAPGLIAILLNDQDSVSPGDLVPPNLLP